MSDAPTPESVKARSAVLTLAVAVGVLVVLAGIAPASGYDSGKSRDTATQLGSEAASRWIPDECRQEALGAGSVEPEGGEEDAEARWNRRYRQGVGALGDEDFALAQRSFCAALTAATAFGSRDWRFAETLDELGLVGFLSADLDFAEAVQGAAVAEMLLALGPDEEATANRPGRQSRLSSAAIYAARLAYIYGLQGRTELAAETTRHPYRVLERGYLPLDETLAHRLGWLVSQYLLDENFDVADWLVRLQSEIAQGHR